MLPYMLLCFLTCCHIDLNAACAAQHAAMLTYMLLRRLKCHTMLPYMPPRYPTCRRVALHAAMLPYRLPCCNIYLHVSLDTAMLPYMLTCRPPFCHVALNAIMLSEMLSCCPTCRVLPYLLSAALHSAWCPKYSHVALHTAMLPFLLKFS